MTKTPPIDYATPQPRARREITSVPLMLALAVPTIALYVAALAIVPAFVRIFADFKLDLPAIAVFTLSFARWMKGWGWTVLWAVPVVLPLVLTQLGASSHPGANRASRVLWSLNLGLSLTLVVVVWLGLALFLPMVQLVQQVSPPR